MQFDVDVNVSPVRNAYINIPAAFQERAMERLRQMEAIGIIEKIPSDVQVQWLSGLSAVPKGKNDFRLVVNMKGPNTAIIRQPHHIPTLDEIRLKVHGAKYFTKLDLKDAFYHIRISEASSNMTAFLTPDGRYRYKKLVFGVNCAPEIFQRTMDEKLRRLEGVLAYLDDLLVFGNSKEELAEREAAVIKRLKENNLTLNKDKCMYCLTKVPFVGHQLSAEGINIDETKVRDILAFREPVTMSELRSFLGLVTFVAKYVSRFADRVAVLWEILKGKDFRWEGKHQRAFKETKEAIACCTTTLGYYCLDDATFLYTDASPNAIGAVLTQKDCQAGERIISFASKTLTKTERNYSQTQREALAVVWSAEHFHYYLLGRKFTIRTDARGLLFIFDRDAKRTKRIMSRAEGWALRMGAFNFSIEHISGNENIADPSSRLYVGDSIEFEDDYSPCDLAVITIKTPDDVGFKDLSISIPEIQLKSTEDEEIKEVRRALEFGEWPSDLSAYKSVSDRLYVVAGLLMRDEKVILPKTLRAKAMQLAHRGHPGQTAMKTILRDRVWWPHMDVHVNDWVKSCKACTVTSRNDPPTPMERSRLPEAPWDILAVDFNGPYRDYGGISILLIIDVFSRYAIAKVVKSTDFETTRRAMNDVFDTFGYPAKIRSDNGPPFNSNDWKKFLCNRGIMVENSCSF